jgi:preprotein translocase subunit SecG
VLFAAAWTSWIAPILNILVLVVSVFLILLVLIQRGKGGGLAGAFGGVGGSSPFGSRAGDTFTRITIGVAGVWILLIMFQIWAITFLGKDGDTGAASGSSLGKSQPAQAPNP